jgi:hypothetical protein
VEQIDINGREDFKDVEKVIFDFALENSLSG